MAAGSRRNCVVRLACIDRVYYSSCSVHKCNGTSSCGYPLTHQLITTKTAAIEIDATHQESFYNNAYNWNDTYLLLPPKITRKIIPQYFRNKS